MSCPGLVPVISPLKISAAMKESLVAIYTIYDNKNGPETRVSGPEIGCGAGFEPTTFRA